MVMSGLLRLDVLSIPPTDHRYKGLRKKFLDVLRVVETHLGTQNRALELLANVTFQRL